MHSIRFAHSPERLYHKRYSFCKTGLKEFYENCGFRYVSTHPMFGPTFANLDKLSTENAIIIKEGDHLGKFSSKICIKDWDLTSSNIHSRNTMKQ